jgi:hypothetical protein
LQACKRNNKWFDSFNCFAAAEVLESEVVVFKHLHGQWVYFQKFVPSKCSSKEPIPLFLKNGHFQTIDPSVPLPSHWHDFDPKDVGPALSFLGGGKRACAGSARVSSTKSAKTGKSDSLSSWFKPQSAKTVKKQVLRSQKASGSAHGSGLTDASPAGSSWFRPQKVTTKKKEKQVPGAARSLGRSLKASPAAFSKWFRPQKQANPSGSGGQQHSLARAVCPALQEDKDTIAADLPLLDDLLANRRRRQKPLKEPCVWICPTCKLRLEHKTSTGLSQKKLNHVKSRHPNMDQTSLRDPRKKVPYALTKELPPEQLVWACPICGAGHPALPNQEHKRAVAHHIKQFHPKETPRSLFHKIATGRPKRKFGVSKMQIKKHAKHRKENYGTHNVILLPQTKGKVHRGKEALCARCLCRIGKGTPEAQKRTCKEWMRQLKNDPHALRAKRRWWETLLEKDSAKAQQFLELSDWTKESLEAFLAPKYETEAKRKAGEKRRATIKVQRQNRG